MAPAPAAVAPATTPAAPVIRRQLAIGPPAPAFPHCSRAAPRPDRCPAGQRL